LAVVFFCNKFPLEGIGGGSGEVEEEDAIVLLFK
jgi:hypothetical protein